MFNTKYIAYLENQNEKKDKRIEMLESRLMEVLDAKLFNRAPERLVKEKTETKPPDLELSAQSDAFSVAMNDAWEKSKPKGE